MKQPVWSGLVLGALLLVSASVVAQTTIPPRTSERLNTERGRQLVLPCGAEGQRCCRPPASLEKALNQPLATCKTGLGCNLATNQCVQPCGALGQACCDGPETRAPRWTADGKVYSPNSRLLRDMCAAGSACDRQSRRCFACGTTDGAPCCPPDAQQATARCSGQRMYCQYDGAGLYVSGTCRMCGTRGRAPCSFGCDAPLGVLKGVCELCSREGQPPCDGGCQPNLSLVAGVCRACGNLNQPTCEGRCFRGLGVRNGVCMNCGVPGQPPCDGGCRAGTALIDGACVACGGTNQPPCAAGCNYPLRTLGGRCQQCGGAGQAVCDAGCNAGLVAANGRCQFPSQPPSGPSCAALNEMCFPPGRPGIQCCTGGTPLLCVYGQCRSCVPSGQTCELGGPQLCCTYGEVCRLDEASGGAKCGIPD